MPNPPCASCGEEGYSHSTEHNNVWLCHAHFREFLAEKEREDIELRAKKDPAFKKMLEEILRGAK